MPSEFDYNTIVNLNAALDYVCKNIPAKRDSHELRKQVAGELPRCARSGRRNLIDLQNAGTKVVNDALKPQRFSWLRLFCWAQSGRF